MRTIGMACLVLLITAANSFAHYNMLLPEKPWAEKGEKITFTYQYGHPYEHELSDAPKPVALVVLTPKGGRQVLDIDKLLVAVKKDGADGKKVTSWQFIYSPAERGDYTFVLKTPLIKHDENHFVEDIVKVVLHVQTQNGWDTIDPPFGDKVSALEMRPLTRPYGILPGMAFHGRVSNTLAGHEKYEKRDARSLANGVTVEIEKYNPKPVKNLPPDELITFKTKTTPAGDFVTALPEAGWWSMTASLPSIRETNGKTMLTQRATLWVHVDEKK
jgi:uncharacterized GH25 family protein